MIVRFSRDIFVNLAPGVQVRGVQRMCLLFVRWRRAAESVAGNTGNSRPVVAVHKLLVLRSVVQCAQ